MIRIYKITGNSMYPEYCDKDYLIVFTLFKKQFIKNNQNIVFIHSRLGLIIKKIVSIDYLNKTFCVKGNNNQSISSEMLGIINFSQIKGVPLLHIKNNSN